jgi:hypothetical protein
VRLLSLAVRVFTLPVHLALYWLQRLTQIVERPRYQIRGGCHHNGQCCRQLLLVEAPFLTWTLLRWLTRFWMERIYPFDITETAVLDPDSGDFYRILRCRNLVDRRCREYWLRPRLCRIWPEPSTAPRVLFKGCGFWVSDRLGAEGVDVSRRRVGWEDGAEELARRWRDGGEQR